MHSCPRCGQACYCHGDIDDCMVETEAYSSAHCTCDCDGEPEEDDGWWCDDSDDRCDQCGTKTSALFNGLCPMCHETGGGVLHRRLNKQTSIEKS